MAKWISNKAGPLLALLLVVLLFAGLDRWKNGNRSRFFSVGNAQLLCVRASPVAVAALGMTVVIIAGGIDLSAGTAIALCATVLAWCLRENYGPVAGAAACVGVGLVGGLINGALIASLRVVPFIVTLGTMMVYLGAAKLIAQETTIHLPPEQVPAFLSRAGLVNPFPLPPWLVPNVLPNFASGVWIALALAIFLALVLRNTVFGRYVFAVGSNESTARLCGVNVPLMKVAVYALAGVFVGLAGIYQFSKLTMGNPTGGIGMELRVIAAVVIGGASLSGGRGSLVGTLAGALMMELIQSGCSQMGWGNASQDIVIGAIIVLAAAVDQLRQRMMRS